MTSEKNVIALLTDFGTKDYFVGAMKGVILSIAASARIVDITHEIPAQNTRAAAFTLKNCYGNFPSQTIFTAVVDPGVGSARRALLVETEKYFFIAPDNGLLGFVFEEAGRFKVYELTNKKYFLHEISRTFHGRDVFSPVAAHLFAGVDPKNFGAEVADFVRSETPAPFKISETRLEAEILHIDHFGNLVTNLRRENLPDEFRIEFKNRKIEKLLEYFAEAEAGEIFMFYGSSGFLEIAANRASAEKILGARPGEKIVAEI